MLDQLASIATIVATAGAFAIYGDARRKAIHHLKTHIAIARQWVLGPSDRGWSAGDITPAIILTWSHPRNQQIPLFSASPLSQVTLLPNVFLPDSLTPHLAQVAQSIEVFNDAIAMYNAFKVSSPQMFISVERKIDAVTATMYPPEVERYPEDMPQADLDRIMRTAGLTPDEDAWSDALFRMLLRAHVAHIGNAAGHGLFRRLQELEIEAARQL